MNDRRWTDPNSSDYFPSPTVMTTHRHVSIPKCETSHPDNPIPFDPSIIVNASTSALNRRAVSTSALSRSSAESLKSDNDGSIESTSTPPTEPVTDVIINSAADSTLASLSIDAAEHKPRKSRRRASTQVLSTKPADLKKFFDYGTAQDGAPETDFLQKYCCGGGCCMFDKAAKANGPDAVSVPLPDNDAFRALGLQMRALGPDTVLTKTYDLPLTSLSLEPAPESPASTASDSFNTHPPNFVQPHPPYSVFPAPLYHARQLTQPGAEKRTYHFDLDITDYPEEGGVDFKVGGAIGICPPNDVQLVDDVFNQLGMPKFVRDKPIMLNTQGGRWPTIWGEEEQRSLITTRRELLTWCSDISSTAPTKALIRLLAEHATDANEKKILLYLCSAQGQATFCDLRTGAHITLPQLLHAFPSTKPPLEALLSVLPQLMPRFYSLSNDPFESSAREGLAGRRLIEIAVTVHETPNWRGESRTGVGSGFLERTARQFAEAEAAGQTPKICMPIFRGLMANPLSREFASDGPMMLIGAGVGMAPFRGFILNRLRNANCANKIWLIQGVRDSMLDEIYRGELGHHEQDIKKVVQSRVGVKPPPVSEADPDVIPESETAGDKGAILAPDTHTASGEKKMKKTAKYVQDEVRCQADVVWFVLNAIDGRIFVCGSTKGMGEGVESALIDVIMDKGGLNDDEAKQFLDQKKEAGQYIAVSLSTT